MAGVREEVTLDQFAQFAQRVGIRTVGVDFRPFLKQAQFAIANDTKKNFDQGSAPDGTPWAGLARTRVRGAGKPLRDRGLLMAAATAQHPTDGGIRRMSSDTLEFGVNLEYGATHQYGATIRPKLGQFLAIPATIDALRQPARNFPGDLIAIIGKSGRGGVLVEKKNRSQVHYYLTRQVTIPARPFLGFGDRLLETLDALILDFAEKRFQEPM